jgi:hypothetical protein
MSSSIFTRYSYGWITMAFFLLTLAGHWLFGWSAYVDEQTAHGQPVEFSSYAVQMTRDTFENWQSEFLQLVWQVGGLAMLLWVGSPQSKEGDDRVGRRSTPSSRSSIPRAPTRLLEEIDAEFEGRHTDRRYARERRGSGRRRRGRSK